MLDVFARFLSRLRKQGQGEDEVADDDYDDYWMEFEELYLSQRAEYDLYRESVSWDREECFPTVAVAMLLRHRTDSLTDHDVLDAWSIFVRDEDGAGFSWYQSVQNFFEERDRALQCNSSCKLPKWSWLYIVADRYPWPELRYCNRLGDKAARSMLLLPDRPS